MKAFLVLLFSVTAACATPIPVNVGPRGITYQRAGVLANFNGIALAGQTITFSFAFSDTITILPLTASAFEIGLDFVTNASAFAGGFIHGSGSIFDESGSPLTPRRRLGSAASSDGNELVGLFPLLLDNGAVDPTLSRPLTFSGATFTLRLPNDPGVFITSLDFDLFAPEIFHNGNHSVGFRIGPHVPETGSTLALLATGIACCFLLRIIPTSLKALKTEFAQCLSPRIPDSR